MIVIAINAPPRAGKDTVADMIVKLHKSARKFKLAGPVKKGTHASLGLMVPEDFFENCKDEERAEFFGHTPRQAYIFHSENYMKALYGQDIFGKLMLAQLKQHDKKHGPAIALLADCGFAKELETIGAQFTVILLRIHRVGKDFTNDSRSYLEWENSWDIINNGNLINLHEKIEQFLEYFKLI